MSTSRQPSALCLFVACGWSTLAAFQCTLWSALCLFVACGWSSLAAFHSAHCGQLCACLWPVAGQLWPPSTVHTVVSSVPVCGLWLVNSGCLPVHTVVSSVSVCGLWLVNCGHLPQCTLWSALCLFVACSWSTVATFHSAHCGQLCVCLWPVAGQLWPPSTVHTVVSSVPVCGLWLVNCGHLPQCTLWSALCLFVACGWSTVAAFHSAHCGQLCACL